MLYTARDVPLLRIQIDCKLVTLEENHLTDVTWTNIIRRPITFNGDWGRQFGLSPTDTY